MHLFLDDVREAPEGWIKCTTPFDVIMFLMRYNVDGFEVQEISLDNDLGSPLCEGYDVLKWMEVFINICPEFKVPVIYVHSANPVAYEKMYKSVSYIYRQKGRNVPSEINLKV